MRITSQGQVTIPQAIREQFGLMPNVEVEFLVEQGRVIVAPRPAPGDRGDRAVDRLRGRADTALSTDEILALTRG